MRTKHWMTHARRGVMVGAGLVVSVLLLGCAGGGETRGTMAEGVVHEVTQEDRAMTRSAAPLEWDSAVLWVNGLGCPQCSNNVDRQLKRLLGVQDVHVDLSGGKVSVRFIPGRRPSGQRLSQAMENAGVTLVKIEKGPEAGWVGAP